MPWNDQSGGSGGNKGGGGGGGPWGSGPRQPWGQPPRQTPPQGAGGPDLEDMLRRARERFRGWGGGNGGSGRTGRGPGGFGWPLIAGVLIAGWLLTGVYVVDEPERAVITRFGDFNRVTGPGIHVHLPPPIEARRVENVTGQRFTDIGFILDGERSTDNSDESLMITGDRNIVEIHFRVTYNISDPVAFAFNVDEPEFAVRAVAESAMREVIGRRQLEQIITTERALVEQSVLDLTQQVLNEYEAGVEVLQVQLRSAAAPQAVIAAFNDVVIAGQDAEALRNNANRETAAIVNQAQAYREQVVREASGEAARFSSVYNEYRQSPRVTRDRIYLETMERVFRDANTVVLDQRGGAVTYLPLDQILRQNRPAVAPQQPQAQGGTR